MKNSVIRGIITLSAVILTAKLGRIEYMGHTETWYDLPMNRIIERTDSMLGVNGLYHIDERGVKMYGDWVIVAADKTVTRYSFVETSFGKGIVLDNHVTGDPNLYDIATSWGKTGDGSSKK